MGLIEDSISDFIFTRTDNWNFNEITLTGTDLAVLAEINGATTLGAISSRLDLFVNDLKQSIDRLASKNLIQIGDFRRDGEKQTGGISKQGSDNITGDMDKPRPEYRIYRGVKYRIG